MDHYCLTPISACHFYQGFWCRILAEYLIWQNKVKKKHIQSISMRNLHLNSIYLNNFWKPVSIEILVHSKSLWKSPLTIDLVYFTAGLPYARDMSAIRATSVRYDCNMNDTSATRVRYQCNTIATRTTQVGHERHDGDTSENFWFW